MISSEGLSESYLHVNNCGRQSLCKSDTYTLRKHGRVDYHILYILSGVCHATINGKAYKVTEGCVALFLPNTPQEYRFFQKDKSESVWIHFTGVGCEEYLRELSLYERAVFKVGKNAELISAVDAMLRTKTMGGAENDKICDSYLHLVLSLMSKAACEGGTRSASHSDISAVVDYMGKNYNEELAISEYAAMCHLSKSRFEHVFKEAVGTTPTGYIRCIRMKAAMNLLETTNLCVSEIAEECGFSDANYFTRLFRKYVGTSPAKYRIGQASKL